MDTLQKKILCPSILNLSTDNMREEIEKLDATDMDIYHVDIMDGTFVPNFGMSVRELEMIRRITDAGHHLRHRTERDLQRTEPGRCGNAGKPLRYDLR